MRKLLLAIFVVLFFFECSAIAQGYYWLKAEKGESAWQVAYYYVNKETGKMDDGEVVFDPKWTSGRWWAFIDGKSAGTFLTEEQAKKFVEKEFKGRK